MAAPIVVNLQVGGVREAMQALRTVEQAALRAARGEVRASQTAEREKVAAAKRAAAEKERQERRSIQLQLNSAKIRNKAIADEARTAEKAAADKVRADEAAARKREALERRMVQIQINSARMAQRAREQAAAAEAAAAKKSYDARLRFARGVMGGAASGVASGVGRVLSVGSTLAGAALAVGGGATAVDAVRDEIAARGAAKQLEINSGGSVSSQVILKKSREVGEAFGLGAKEVVNAMDAFVAKSGDVQAGFDMIGKLVELATATGADLGELSTLAGTTLMTTGDKAATENLMRTFAGMGRAGAVDIRELAQYGGRIVAGATSFGDKRKAEVQLSAIAQESVGPGGATDAAEATTTVSRLSKDIYGHRSEWDSKGIKLTDKTGGLRDPMSLMKEAIQKTRGNEGLLRKMLGIESYKAIHSYASTYREAAFKTEGTAAQKDAAGMAAVEERMQRFIRAVLTEQQVREEASKRMQEVDKQLDKAMTQLKEAIATGLLPVLPRLIEAIKKIIPYAARFAEKFASLVEAISENPWSWEGLGQVAAVALTASIANAMIGKLVAAAIVAAIEAAAVSMAEAAAVSVGAIVSSVLGGLLAGFLGGKLLFDKSEENDKANAAIGRAGGAGASDIAKKVNSIAITDQASYDENKAAFERLRVIRDMAKNEPTLPHAGLSDEQKKAIQETSDKTVPMLNEALKNLSSKLDAAADKFDHLRHKVAGAPIRDRVGT